MNNVRKSAYLISVKLENEKGKYMLIHGYTGAIDIITEDIFNKLNTSINELPDITLEKLIKRGYLTNKSMDEEHAYVIRLVKALHKKECLLRNSFTWVVTYNCNFRCPYCFEGRENKDSKKKIVFTKEQVDNAFQVIESIQQYKKNNIMVLYGGEPLLDENKEIVEYIVKKGQSKGYKFKAITNGYELDSFLDLLSPDAIYKLQITVDGTKDIHDQRRIHYKNKNTFDKIMYNIKLALDLNVEILIRVNIDSENVGKLAELKEYFMQSGFYNYPKFSMYSAVLRDYETITSQEHENLNFISAQSYVNEHKEGSTQDICYDYGISKLFYKAISENTAVTFRSFFCLAQLGGYVLAPLGKIYPCWEVIGDEHYLIGNYYSNKIKWDNKKLDTWRGYDVTKNEKCSHCKYALFCGGGCPAHAMSNKNNHCTFFRNIFKVSVNRAYNKVCNSNRQSIIKNRY